MRFIAMDENLTRYAAAASRIDAGIEAKEQAADFISMRYFINQ
jgi:hypothetical protein